MKLNFFLAIALFYQVCLSAHHLVFIHIGKELPSYVEDAIAQAELFNPDCDIHLLGSMKAISSLMKKYQNSNIHIHPLETIHKSGIHKDFCQSSENLSQEAKDGAERFFYLSDFATKMKLSSIFYVENDVMLYSNLKELLPLFETLYQHIAATFDNDNRCVPGFMFFKDSESLTHLAKFMAKHIKPNFNEMQAIATYRLNYGREYIDFLPITTGNYDSNFPMISAAGDKTTDKKAYSNFINFFESIFDPAALGEFISVAPSSTEHETKLMNSASLINPRHFSYSFEEDKQKRIVPYISCKGERYRVNNLHIRSKNLKKFSSKSKDLLSKPPLVF